ncbi:hypothetical protein AB0442_32040 [Kitasatospora sp. NPDC085895]|uniref:hypothetical protein n=1 Tax=Kitasatospora sp. NPDC085895 TaxID=3155057 RepID=UPI00344EF331
MPESDLTPEEIALVREYVEILPGVAMDRLDVQRARLAKAVGGWFRKVGPGMYEIVTETPPPRHAAPRPAVAPRRPTIGVPAGPDGLFRPHRMFERGRPDGPAAPVGTEIRNRPR